MTEPIHISRGGRFLTKKIVDTLFKSAIIGLTIEDIERAVVDLVTIRMADITHLGSDNLEAPFPAR
jgi:hypothetical protein